MSISRGSGADETWCASATRLSVVLPIAETTTTSRLPQALAATRRATFLIFSSSATDEPPYFWTISAIELEIYHDYAAGRACVASPRLTCSRRRESQPRAMVGRNWLA